MMEAYRSGDPYLAFAKQAGAAPTCATKGTHKEVRDQFKSTVLAVQYVWAPTHWPPELVSRQFELANCFAFITKRIVYSGAGPTPLSTTPC